MTIECVLELDSLHPLNYDSRSPDWPGFPRPRARRCSRPRPAPRKARRFPASQVPKDITDAINSPERPAADKALDAGRRPDQIMAFYGIKPGMKVADIFAGGGYMTELYRANRRTDRHSLFAEHARSPNKFKKIGDAWNERLKEPALKNVVKVSKPFDAPDLLPVPPESLDAVIIHLNYHDMVGFKLHRDNVNAAVFKALKPGGIYGIVDHSAQGGHRRHADDDAPSHRRGFSDQGRRKGRLQTVRRVERAASS